MKQLGWLVSAAMWLLVAGSVVVLAGGFFGRPLLLAAVPTGSMVPVMSPGDMIVVLPTWVAAPPEPGSIVVFRTEQEQRWVVHRIVGGDPAEGFVTRGDANRVPDPDRVFPQEIAAVVPQYGGRVLRLPRLGLLSAAGGPLSSPVVAGVALVMGLYLLVLDLRFSVSLPRLNLRRRAEARPTAIFMMYMGLAGTAFLSTLIPAWTLSSSQQLRYEVVEQVDLRHTRQGRYARGVVHQEQIPITNPSPLPMVIFFTDSDPNLSYSPESAVIQPHAAATFTVTIRTPTAGSFQGRVNMGVFPSLLPPVIMTALGRVSFALAAVVCALVPALLLIGVAFADARTRKALRQISLRIQVRFGL